MSDVARIKPVIDLEAYTLGEKLVGVAVLKERVAMHTTGRIQKGKRGDLLVCDGAGLTLFLPAEALALFERAEDHDGDVASLAADVYIV